MVSTAITASSALNNALRLADRERAYLSLKEDYDALSLTCTSQQGQITSLQAKIADLQAQCSERVDQVATAQEKADRAARRVQAMEEKERDTNERMGRMEIEADSLRQEIRCV